MARVRARRNKVAIVAEILERASAALATSRVFSEANVSSRMMSKYLSLMVRAQLLEQVPLGARTSLQISDKGKKFLQLYHEIEALLETDERRKHLNKNGVQSLPKGLSPDRFSARTGRNLEKGVKY
jgi:predicted transcriptional regulator